MSYGILGCPEQDSNLHASQHSHLKRARLPFRHLGIAFVWGCPGIALQSYDQFLICASVGASFYRNDVDFFVELAYPL